jgi:phosphoribosyl-ATP pyrophosphohydrolase
MALASVTEDRERVIGEAADLLYHFLVLLQARRIDLAEVEAVLKKRSGQSGLAEKAARIPDRRPSDL